MRSLLLLMSAAMVLGAPLAAEPKHKNHAIGHASPHVKAKHDTGLLGISNKLGDISKADVAAPNVLQSPEVPAGSTASAASPQEAHIAPNVDTSDILKELEKLSQEPSSASNYYTLEPKAAVDAPVPPADNPATIPTNTQPTPVSNVASEPSKDQPPASVSVPTPAADTPHTAEAKEGVVAAVDSTTAPPLDSPVIAPQPAAKEAVASPSTTATQAVPPVQITAPPADPLTAADPQPADSKANGAAPVAVVEPVVANVTAEPPKALPEQVVSPPVADETAKAAPSKASVDAPSEKAAPPAEVSEPTQEKATKQRRKIKSKSKKDSAENSHEEPETPDGKADDNEGVKRSKGDHKKKKMRESSGEEPQTHENTGDDHTAKSSHKKREIRGSASEERSHEPTDDGHQAKTQSAKKAKKHQQPIIIVPPSSSSNIYVDHDHGRTTIKIDEGLNELTQLSEVVLAPNAEQVPEMMEHFEDLEKNATVVDGSVVLDAQTARVVAVDAARGTVQANGTLPRVTHRRPELEDVVALQTTTPQLDGQAAVQVGRSADGTISPITEHRDGMPPTTLVQEMQAETDRRQQYNADPWAVYGGERALFCRVQYYHDTVEFSPQCELVDYNLVDPSYHSAKYNCQFFEQRGILYFYGQKWIDCTPLSQRGQKIVFECGTQCATREGQD